MKRYLRNIVTIDDMQFGLMPGIGTIGAVLIIRRLQEYLAKQNKLYMCFVDQENYIEFRGKGNEKKEFQMQ